MANIAATPLKKGSLESMGKIGKNLSEPVRGDSKQNVAADQVRIDMFAEALKIRMVEDEIARRYKDQEMRCPTHLCTGQEVPPVAVSQHLNAQDFVFSAHRSHGHYIAKGGDLPAMIAELYGKQGGCARGKGGSQHLIDLNCGFMGSAPILASTISVGVGAAWAAKRRKEDRIVVIYFGDGATEEGSFHEAMNFAGVNALPVLFVCENNLYSVHTPLSTRQPVGRSIWQIANIHGAKGMYGNGNDIDEAWDLANKAVSHIRSGAGPVLLEYKTYRWKEHCGPNDDSSLGYRSPEEIQGWIENDPLDIYDKRLRHQGLVSDNEVAKIRGSIETKIDAAFAFAESSHFPRKPELFEFVFPTS